MKEWANDLSRLKLIFATLPFIVCCLLFRSETALVGMVA
jgi:hypothetical protein